MTIGESAPRTATNSWVGRRQIFGYIAAAMMALSLYLALVVGPVDAVQGVHSRIFYVHVPIALTTYVAFSVVFVGSVGYLWTRKDRWDRLARVSAEIGVVTTTLTLITGSLWGRPVWGAFWDWNDARLVT